MINMDNILKKHKFLFLVLLGLIIQAFSLYITYKTLPYDESWFAGIGVAVRYIYGQLIGIVVQLAIMWKITGKIATAFKVCGTTISIILFVFITTLK